MLKISSWFDRRSQLTLHPARRRVSCVNRKLLNFGDQPRAGCRSRSRWGRSSRALRRRAGRGREFGQRRDGVRPVIRGVTLGTLAARVAGWPCVARLAVGVSAARVIERVNVPIDDAFVTERAVAGPVSSLGVARSTTVEHAMREIPTLCRVTGCTRIGIVAIGQVIGVAGGACGGVDVVVADLRPGRHDVTGSAFAVVVIALRNVAGMAILAQSGTAVVVRDLLPTVGGVTSCTLSSVVSGRQIVAVAVYAVFIASVVEIRIAPATGGMAAAARTGVVIRWFCTTVTILATG